jgi:hypothetical protein
MATITNKDIEAEARDLLRKQIQESAWYPWMKADERRKRIEEDVDQYWYVKVSEASQRLMELAGAETRRGSDSERA